MPFKSKRRLTIGLLFAFSLSLPPAMAASPFCSDPGCKATRQTFKELCDFIVANKASGPVLTRHGKPTTAISIAGYYMRALVAGYEIFGERRYLDTASTYGDTLLKEQMPSGYWATGYGPVYFADTGSALGLFIVLYKHVDRERQGRYMDAVQRYVNSLQKDGMIHSNGALGVGWEHVQDGKLIQPIPDEYTTSSALTGGEIFTWMYHMTKEEKYRRMAYEALHWVLGTMREDGVIPYVLAAYGASLGKKGDPRNDFFVWDELRYLNAAYVGEGLLSFDLHCDQPEWKADLRKMIKPNIEWLLATQNPSGNWSAPSQEPGCRATFDLTRTPGIANLLIWYYEQVDRDPRIVSAVRKFDQFLMNPQEGKALGLLNRVPLLTTECNNQDTVTSLMGYALSDILVPGISSRW
jgi:hypothetical protein